MGNTKESNNDLPAPIAPTEPKKQDTKKTEDIPDIQTEPTQTGVIQIKEDTTKGLIRVFRFKLLVTSCEKNTSFKEGVIDIKKVEHVHWYRTADARTGVAHDRATLTCGHSHPITIAYKKDKSGKIVGIDMDACVIGPAIREVSVGALNSDKRVKRWLAVLLGIKNDVNADFQEVTKKIYDTHIHKLEYIDYEDINLQKARMQK